MSLFESDRYSADGIDDDDDALIVLTSPLVMDLMSPFFSSANTCPFSRSFPEVLFEL